MYTTDDYPKQGDMAPAILKCLVEMGGSIVFSSQGAILEDKLADFYGLSSEQRLRTDAYCNAQGRRVWRNHIQYARNKMVERGLLDSSIRDVWLITRTGYESLATMEFLLTEDTAKIAVTRKGKVEIISEDEESAFPEGAVTYRLHRDLERKKKIVQLAKQLRLTETAV